MGNKHRTYFLKFLRDDPEKPLARILCDLFISNGAYLVDVTDVRIGNVRYVFLRFQRTDFVPMVCNALIEIQFACADIACSCMTRINRYIAIPGIVSDEDSVVSVQTAERNIVCPNMCDSVRDSSSTFQFKPTCINNNIRIAGCD